MSTFRKIMRNPSAVVGLCILLLLVVVSIAGPFLVESPYEQNTAVKLMPPSAEHWFGTDDFGRDVCSAGLSQGRTIPFWQVLFP